MGLAPFHLPYGGITVLLLPITATLLASFQVFNLVVAAAAFLFDPSVRELTRNWYALGGALVVSTMLGDAFFIQVLPEPACNDHITATPRPDMVA